MRILFAADVAPDPDSGAAGTEWQTIQALRRLGHEVDEIWAGDLGRRIAHGNLHYLLELPRAYRRVIGARTAVREYDAIHANQGHCYLAALDHRRARRPGVFVCRSHGLDDHMEAVLAPWRRRLGVRARRGLKALTGGVLDRLLHRHDRLAYRYASGVIVSSTLDRDWLVHHRRVPAERVACIPQAPAEAFVRTPAPEFSAERSRRLLHVGGFAYWKGVHAVAAAASKLLSTRTDVRFTWVCRGSEQASVRALFSSRVRDLVDLRSWGTQEQLLATYDEHGILLCPSLFEGFGKVFLEGMARGMCVIGTPTGGMRDIIRDGVTGLLVPFDDAGAIVACIDRLLADVGSARSIAAAAAARAQEYSWPRVGLEAASFYAALRRQRGEA